MPARHLRPLAAALALGLACAASFPAHAAPAPAFPNVQVSRDAYLAHSEPALAMNPRNHKNLLAGSKMFTDPTHYEFKIGTYYSKNGGKTWHDSGFLPGFDDFDLVSDVSIAYGPGGTAYVCVLAWDGKDASGIYVLRSTNGGKSFSQPVAVFLDTTGAVFNDKPWITVDSSMTASRGTVYVAWNLDGPQAANHDPDGGDAVLHPQQVTHGGVAQPRQVSSYGDGGIAVSRSTDGGRSFSSPLIVAPFDTDHFSIGAIPAVAPDGTLSVAFVSYDGTGQVDGMALVTSTDGGQTFSPVRIVQDDVVGLPNHLDGSTFRNTSMPAFVISPTDGSMMMAWGDYRYNDADVMASTSEDGGKTWSSPVRVNHDRMRNGRDQFMPALAVSPNGVYTCAWFDRSYSANPRLIDEVVAQSSSDGHAFGPALRVTERSWDPAVDAPRPEGKASNTFIGDYQALVADNHTVHPLWNDTQNGKSQQIHTATIGMQVFKRK